MGENNGVHSRVQAALDRIRPVVQMDGGDVQLVDVSDEGVVTVQMMGACGGCPMSMLTLKAGIERIVKQQVPEVTEIVAL